MSIRVERKNNESLDRLLKRFKKKCENEGLLKDFRKNEYYESKGERRRRAKKRSLKKFEKEKEVINDERT